MKTISDNAMDKAQEYYNVKGAANTVNKSVTNATNRIRITTIAGDISERTQTNVANARKYS